jgi:tetratricopeptide (TPR) repeat protein
MRTYNLFCMQKSQQIDQFNVARINTNVTNQHSSLRDLSELKSLLLKDMKVNQIHHGYYLECKTLVNPIYVAGMYFVVEDKTGETESVMLYNFNVKLNHVDPSFLIPAGTNLIIKEPFLKLYACGNGEFGIRVESPTDVIIMNNESFSQSVAISKSVDQLIDEGNAYFQKSDFYTSIRYYTEALKKSNETSPRAILNRSASYFKLERYYLAYKDAEQAVRLDEKSKKAYYRMGRACYEMRQYELAETSFKNFLKYEKLNDAEVELKRCQNRINEQLTGNYDFSDLLDQALNKQNLFLDAADYKSNKIRIGNVKNKSKGVIASEDIKKGELLVVSKSVISAQMNQNSKKYLDLSDPAQIVSNVVYKMHSDPYLAKQLYSLYAGPDFNRDEKLNEFCIDIARIISIQKYNSFTIENDFEFKKPNKNESGLWIFPSYFNHSCVSNSIKIFLGDLLIIHALKDIKKDEEITIRYSPSGYTNLINYAERSDITSRLYNFKCDCQLCKLDGQDFNLKKREKLSKEVMSKMTKIEKLSLNECLEDVAQMRDTYSKRSDLQISLIPALLNLGRRYRENFNYQKSTKIFEELFHLTKNVSFMHAIFALKQASIDYEQTICKEKYDWCYETALEYFGKNKPLFKKFWENYTYFKF